MGKFWGVVFCSIFTFLCLLSIICVMSINVHQLDKSPAFAESKEALVIDDFEGDEIINGLGYRANVYVQAPSKVMISHKKDSRDGKPTTVLFLKYEKANEGGPYGVGGWCGYYTILKNDKDGRYFDGSEYKYISFWLRGENGSENFNVGLADRHWDKIGDSFKSDEMIKYIEGNKMPAAWTYVRVPLEDFFIDQSMLASISINFESTCFPEGKGSGAVYIDDLMLEK